MVRSSHGLVLSVLGLLIVATIMVNSASLKLRPDHSTTMEAIFLGKQTWFAVGAFLTLVAGAFIPVDRLGATGKRWWTTPAVWMAAAMLVTLASLARVAASASASSHSPPRTAACAIQSKRRISYCRFLVLEARPVSSW
jgi:cell division protein FtsW (lipid II flippase)